MTHPPPLVIPDLPPPPTTLDGDITIVVPPTPTNQLLPLSETDGLTSGAVQPPGSTGEETKHEVVRVTVGESGEDTDGSSEDEPSLDGHQVEEWEDDEQRLIRQGGAGIPVGTVSQNHRPPPWSCSQIVSRTARRNRCCLPSRPSTLARSASSWIWTRLWSIAA